MHSNIYVHINIDTHILAMWHDIGTAYEASEVNIKTEHVKYCDKIKNIKE